MSDSPQPRKDRMVGDALKAAGLAFVMRAMGAGLAFVLSVVTARLLGAESTGLYFLALSVTTLLAYAAKMGLDNSLLRFAASAAAQGDWPRVAGAFRLAVGWAAAASLAVSMLLFLTAPQVADLIFARPDLAGPLRMMSLGIFGFTTMNVIAEGLKGLKQVGASMLVSGAFYPAFALVVIWPAVTAFGAGGASLAYAAGTLAAAGLGYLLWRRAHDWRGIHPAAFPRAEMWGASHPVWLSQMVNRALLPWAPLFLLGIWGQAHEVGIFGAATRVATLVSFLLTAVNTVLAPRFAELHTKGEMARLGHLARRFALFITLAAAPVLLVMIFASGPIMGLFGPEFVAGGMALSILALGQAVNAFTGSVGYLLTMTGHGRDIRSTAYLSVAVLAVLSVALIPGYGMVGAACATAGATASTNILASVFVYRRLGIIVLPWIRTRK